MLTESSADPAHRYLLCIYYFPEHMINRIKADVKQFMANRKKDDLYHAFMEWKKKDNELVVLTRYAYADILLPKQFDIAFQIDNPNNNATGSFVITQAIINGWTSVSQIDHGHKHIVVIEFPGTIPKIFSLLHPFDETMPRNKPEIGLCIQADFKFIKE